ncbi:triosephosphate isomerase [Candidatus Gastranaerophilus sp. (ex Termes propinquus)]|nr:triosephosphate isomerase [Candidatus Gastranaerophilus sp. (ex Termes propinquus)]
MRKPIIAGNWKMHNTSAQSVALAEGIIKAVEKLDKTKLPEVVIAPVFTSIPAVSKTVSNSAVKLSAQNCYCEPKGAFTGEISIEMLKEFNVEYIIIGHSERRQYFLENDEMINCKTKAILAQGLVPIICCGETLEQREAGVTDTHVSAQITKALEGVAPSEVAKTVIAYEPIWAIGTGKTCDSQEANRVIKVIRAAIAQIAGQENADKVRILYGGSVKPDTIDEQMAQSNIDGALVGGASLDAEGFARIVQGALQI